MQYLLHVDMKIRGEKNIFKTTKLKQTVFKDKDRYLSSFWKQKKFLISVDISPAYINRDIGKITWDLSHEF